MDVLWAALLVANICIDEIEEEIEETAIESTPVPQKFGKRYVNNSFCIIKKNAVFN